MLTYGACACARACPHLVANETTEEQIGCARSAHTHHRGHEADACRHLAAFRRRVRRPHLLKELREDRALRCEDVPVAVHHGSAGALVSGQVLAMRVVKSACAQCRLSCDAMACTNDVLYLASEHDGGV